MHNLSGRVTGTSGRVTGTSGRIYRNTQMPEWQPISMLPTFSVMIDYMLKTSQVYLKAMKEAEQNPTIIDDKILTRTLKAVYRAFGES